MFSLARPGFPSLACSGRRDVPHSSPPIQPRSSQRSLKYASTYPLGVSPCSRIGIAMLQRFALAFKTKTIEFFAEEEDEDADDVATSVNRLLAALDAKGAAAAALRREHAATEDRNAQLDRALAPPTASPVRSPSSSDALDETWPPLQRLPTQVLPTLSMASVATLSSPASAYPCSTASTPTNSVAQVRLPRLKESSSQFAGMSRCSNSLSTQMQTPWSS